MKAEETKTAGTQASRQTFSDALQELETILKRIDDEAVDIDGLAEELRRAAELLELCREKIRKADVEVSQIVQKLDVGTGT